MDEITTSSPAFAKPLVSRSLSRFIGFKNIEFGDYLLFQEYEQGTHDGKQYSYKVSKPTLVIYLGLFVCDQTIGFNYVKWVNENHTERITNKDVTNHPICKEVDGIHQHIEWDDYLDILGHWKNKPKWKEIIKSYRCQNEKAVVMSDEIDWSY